MFTIEQARQLRAGMPPVDFSKEAPKDELTQAYVKHYGLDFTTRSRPVTHSMGLYSSPPYKIACQYFSPAGISCKGTIVIVHGYFDHVGLYKHLIRHCLEQDYAVLTFDLPGHGLSSGEVASIESFDRYSEALAGCLKLAGEAGLPQPLHLIGQSTGAAAIINYLLKPAPVVAGKHGKIVLLAPLLRPVSWSRGLVSYYLMHLFVKRTNRNFAANTHDTKFSRFIREDDPFQSRYLMVGWVRSLKDYIARFKLAARSQVAINIIQGTADNTVDWRSNLPKLEEKFPNAKTFLIENAQHHMVNESVEFRAQIFGRIDEILAAR